MRSPMIFLLLLSVLIAILTIAANGVSASSVSANKSTTKPNYRPVVIYNTVQASHCNEAIKSLEATLLAAIEKKFEQLMATMNKTTHGQSFASCRDIYMNQKSEGNKAYFLLMGSTKVPVYCHMTSSGLGACGGGGWTLVMKIDGTKPTFHYDSKLWKNKVDFNLPGGKTGLDTQETKLPTYWNTHFSKICLGMRLGQQTNFIVINRSANSLYALIADGKYRATSMGRDKWRALIGPRVSLEPNCNMEGFNAYTPGKSSDRARIGILGNNENNCDSNGSRIGFGGAGTPDSSNACGNGYPGKSIRAIGYIFVQ